MEYVVINYGIREFVGKGCNCCCGIRANFFECLYFFVGVGEFIFECVYNIFCGCVEIMGLGVVVEAFLCFYDGIFWCISEVMNGREVFLEMFKVG